MCCFILVSQLGFWMLDSYTHLRSKQIRRRRQTPISQDKLYKQTQGPRITYTYILCCHTESYGQGYKLQMWLIEEWSVNLVNWLCARLGNSTKGFKLVFSYIQILPSWKKTPFIHPSIHPSIHVSVCILPVGYAQKTYKGRYPGDILIRCPNHLHMLLLIWMRSSSSEFPPDVWTYHPIT